MRFQVAAGNGTYSDAERRSIAVMLRGMRDEDCR